MLPGGKTDCFLLLLYRTVFDFRIELKSVLPGGKTDYFLLHGTPVGTNCGWSGYSFVAPVRSRVRFPILTARYQAQVRATVRKGEGVVVLVMW